MDRDMSESSAVTKQLRGPQVHVYKAGRLYLKDFFFSAKRPCSVTLTGTTFSVSNATKDLKRVVCLKNAKLMIQQTMKKIVIELENKERLCFFAADENDFQDWATALDDSIHWKIQRYYDLGEELGQGAFATVSKGWCKQNGEAVAIKIIDKTTCSDEDFKYLQREIDISQTLHHPNVVRTLDLFESENRLFIVLEYVEGGTLETFHARNGSPNEHKARRIMGDIFAGIEYMHSKKVAHRDIKPENMLCTSKEFPMSIKLMDFGLARNLNPNTERAEDRYDFGDVVGPDGLMDTPVGTPRFVAPEVLMSKPYGKEIDLFACGVVMYWLLCGYVPFEHPDAEGLTDLIKRTKFEFPDAEWAYISQDAKKLISGLLNRSPHARLTVTQALQHPWFDVHEEPQRGDHSEEPQNADHSVEPERKESNTDQPVASPKRSGSGNMLHKVSLSSDIDDVDDISEVIRLMSGSRRKQKQ